MSAREAYLRLLAVAEGNSPSSDAAGALCAMIFDDDAHPCGVIRSNELTKAELADLMLVLEFRDEQSSRFDDLAPEARERVKAMIKKRR